MNTTRNKGLQRTLLVLTAAVLAVVISVGVTMAYLTAQTTPVDNEFTAAGGITGKVEEPEWNATGKTEAEHFSLGNPIDKDPLIQNTTSDVDIYAGARLDFYIYKEGADGTLETTPTQVSYDVFKAFVDVKYDTSNAFNTGSGTGKWTELTTSTTPAVTTNTNSKYFIYNDILKASTGSNKTTAVSSTYTSNNADCSKPLFLTVTAKDTIEMKELSSGSYSTSYEASGPSGTYKNFKFEIKVTGFGVKAFVTGTQADGLSFDQAKVGILKGLGGSTTDVTTT